MAVGCYAGFLIISAGVIHWRQVKSVWSEASSRVFTGILTRCRSRNKTIVNKNEPGCLPQYNPNNTIKKHLIIFYRAHEPVKIFLNITQANKW